MHRKGKHMQRTLHAPRPLTLAAAGLLAASVAVLAPDANAGGSGDFYKHYSCAVNSSGTANLDVTNYDISTGQRYHIDMDSPSGFQASALYIDGVKQSGWNDRYKDYADRSSVHTFKGVWLEGALPYAKAVSCSLRF